MNDNQHVSQSTRITLHEYVISLGYRTVSFGTVMLHDFSIDNPVIRDTVIHVLRIHGGISYITLNVEQLRIDYSSSRLHVLKVLANLHHACVGLGMYVCT